VVLSGECCLQNGNVPANYVHEIGHIARSHGVRNNNSYDFNYSQ